MRLMNLRSQLTRTLGSNRCSTERRKHRRSHGNGHQPDRRSRAEGGTASNWLDRDTGGKIGMCIVLIGKNENGRSLRWQPIKRKLRLYHILLLMLLVRHKSGASSMTASSSWVGCRAIAGAERFFHRICPKNRMSRPLTPPNQLNQQKTREIKRFAKWHSSFPPARIIKAVEMREKSGACVGLLLFASTTKKSSSISPDGV